MLTSKKFNIEADIESRVKFLLKDYKYVQNEINFFSPLLVGLKNRIDKQIINNWSQYIQNKEWRLLTESLLENHYDPAYNTNYKKKNQDIIRTFCLKTVVCDGLCKFVIVYGSFRHVLLLFVHCVFMC